jgi:hypothetical protein
VSALTARHNIDRFFDHFELLLSHSLSITEAPDTWSDAVKESVQEKGIGIIPYDLTLDYDFWSTSMSSTPPRHF